MKPTPEIAYAVCLDAANASMRKAGRDKWNEDDYNAGVRVAGPLWDMIEHERKCRANAPMRAMAESVG